MKGYAFIKWSEMYFASTEREREREKERERRDEVRTRLLVFCNWLLGWKFSTWFSTSTPGVPVLLTERIFHLKLSKYNM